MDPDSATPSDEALDLIGAIAMHRQAMEQESGAAPARNEALRKLNALLAREREELEAHGPGGRHSANIAAVMLELVKVRNSPDPSAARAGYVRRNQWGLVWQPGASRIYPRHKGRRTMGRAGRGEP
jgi:hypothetical protein